MVTINKTRGDNMAGFDPAKAAAMNALAEQYPNAPLGTLAILANIPTNELGNYTNDSVGTRASNANFGRVTSEESQNVQSPVSQQNNANAIGSAGSQDAFRGVTLPPVDETEAFEREFDALGAPVVPTPTPRPPEIQADVDFDDDYGESFREVTPIPTDSRFPTSRTEELTQNTVDPGLANALRAQEQAAIEASNAFEEPFAPSPFPAPPPPRPVESFNAPVDDFAEYQPPVQVDDFSELNIPPQVDDFGEYQPPIAQVDDFADFQSPAQVNTFGVDDFGDPEAAQFDAFGDPLTAPADVNVFGVDDFGDNNPLGQVDDFSEFGTPTEVNPFGVDDFGDVERAQFDEFGDPILAPEDRVENDGESLVGDDPVADIGDGAEGEGIDGVEQAAISQQQQAALNAQALKDKARQQQTVNEMREASGVKNADGDWRVKLRLAPQATYLYKAPEPGILAPLAVTDGIIFPYTPTIDVQYRAEYQNYSPTHSNYMHYFYKNSSVQTVQLQAEFTAQDTIEAEYLLACIHFLKSASKMFYGQDAERGSPPPLLYLTGLGEYQFNESPCVVTEFNYNLPSDVHYIRARSRHINRDDQLQFTKPLASTVSNGNFSSLNRLKTAITNAISGGPGPTLVPGAKPTTLSPGNLGSKGATYVPTKMSMTINMLPVISRQQASQVFSLKDYANGNGIKKGMW